MSQVYKHQGFGSVFGWSREKMGEFLDRASVPFFGLELTSFLHFKAEFITSAVQAAMLISNEDPT
jgi:hypothetical protein